MNSTRQEKQKPTKKFKAGAVTATVWANEMKDRQGNIILYGGRCSKIGIIIDHFQYDAVERRNQSVLKKEIEERILVK